MKRFVLSVLMLAAFAISAVAAESMSGLITCDKCRHTDAKAQDCAKSCVKNGVKPVFYDSASQKFYQIVNADKAKPHVGHNVVVTGTVEGDNLTIASLKMDSAKGGAKKDEHAGH
ncbi:MAG TPA: hypothetical protein VN428_01955 [Bryobacteraceae bacterium]|nr:hypothetical protein [Bryobacteraceae bacterium]